MSMIMIKVPRQKAEDLKGMINEGLHIFGRAMSLAEDMCRESEMDERRGNYRNDEYLYPVNERNYRHVDMRDDDRDRDRMYERRRSHDRDY